MYVDPRWVAAVAVTSAAFGLLSSVIACRRLFFLAGALPHAALLSATLAVLASRAIGGSVEAWALLASAALACSVAALLSRGVDPDVAAAVFVSLSVSLTVVSMHYVLTRYPVSASLWAYILGDPLLVTWGDVAYVAAVASVAAALTAPFYRAHVLIGIDRDFARLVGLRVGAYDAALTASLAVASVGLLRVAGFVIEHVLLLLPGAVAAMVARSARGLLAVALATSLLGGLAGLLAGLAAGLAPSGLIGLSLLAAYAACLLARWRRGA